MSDNQAGKFIEALGMTDRDLIKSIIAEHFFADFGTVKAVYGSPAISVDVLHAMLPQLFGQQLPPTVTMGVEVLFLGGGAGFSQGFDVAVGDPVLLVGLRDYVKSVKSAVPATTDIPLHYTQETLKAIPLGAFRSTSAVQLVESAGVLTPKGPAGTALASDAVIDPVSWPILTAIAAIFGLTLTSLKGGWH